MDLSGKNSINQQNCVKLSSLLSKNNGAIYKRTSTKNKKLIKDKKKGAKVGNILKAIMKNGNNSKKEKRTTSLDLFWKKSNLKDNKENNLLKSFCCIDSIHTKSKFAPNVQDFEIEINKLFKSSANINIQHCDLISRSQSNERNQNINQNQPSSLIDSKLLKNLKGIDKKTLKEKVNLSQCQSQMRNNGISFNLQRITNFTK